ncbi:MAG TPA: hypothetical protein VF771_10965, partial [Longimicrobiaceae bacterium]
DRFSTHDARFTYATGETTNATVSGLDLDDTRWSIFGNAAYALPIGSVILEGGWMSGGDAVTGFSGGNGYDPGANTIFFGLGLRLSL